MRFVIAGSLMEHPPDWWRESNNMSRDRALKTMHAIVELHQLLAVVSSLTAEDVGLPPEPHLHVEPQSPAGDIRYLHLAEEENQYLMCLFILPPQAVMPLHDHQSMTVVSHMLSGSMQLRAMDWDPSAAVVAAATEVQHPGLAAIVTQNLLLQAPSTVYLTPNVNNLHQVTCAALKETVHMHNLQRVMRTTLPLRAMLCGSYYAQQHTVAHCCECVSCLCECCR
jgi:predicted metal-dependent enzyme (double-stranded beta helix superfamily)